jgi:ribosome biogenesis GTPase
MREGLIVKSLSGFYEVKTEEGLERCRARGLFRKEGITPLVGDQVRIEQGMVTEILPRKNSFLRPPVSNLDLLVVVASEAIPITEPFLIDRVMAIAGNQNVPSLLVINKTDLSDGSRLAGIYELAGIPAIRVSAVTGEGIEALRTAIAGKVCAFTGNSGVGKSSILNALEPDFGLQVGEVSEKLGRGRHTTRHVELYPLRCGALVADTPGFSAFDTERMDLVLKENLQYAFSDFAPYLGKCQFNDCTHLHEPGCQVRQALEEGKIAPSRYASYVQLYEKAKEIREWERKK